MNTCDWKQLIKILLPLTFSIFALQAGLCSASDDDRLDLDPEDRSGSFKTDIDGWSVTEDRTQKVRAKWRGDKFWAEAMANLTISELEREKALQNKLTSNYTTEARMQSNSMPMIMSTTPMPYPDPTMARSRTTLHRGKFDTTKATTIKTTTKPKSTPLTTSSPKSRRTTTTKAKPKTTTKTRTKVTTKPTTKKPSTTKKSKLPRQTQKPKTARPSAFSRLTAAPDQVDRTTLVADLSPFQEYYLEYTSDEVDDKTIPVKNSTNSTQTSNSTSLKIEFYPKTPVNLLYLLQAYASNMKPIKVQSPIAGGPQGSIPVSVPVSIPVRLNPPKSPFLFSMDLDNFFSRMAISFLYSSVAMAPFIYLIIGGLGGLGGLSSILVPFTGGRRRRRRRRDVNSRRLLGTKIPKRFEDLGIYSGVGDFSSTKS